METMPNKPWYKQFWPWFLIAIPLSSVIVGTIVIRFATDGTNSMVVDDYYKEGKTINVRLDKIERARELGLVAKVDFFNEGIVIEFANTQPKDATALKLKLYHATLEEKDTELLLTSDATGKYRADVDFDIKGKWRMQLMPMNEEWKLQRLINLPQASPFKIVPE